jgi:hypothetical protein
VARGTFTITGRVDDAAVRRGLAEVRRAIPQDVKKTTGAAAERITLPAVKRAAPHLVRATMTTKSTTRGAYVTTKARGKNRAIVALTNWGGTIKAPIKPRRRKALKFGTAGGGHTGYAMSVTKPRRIKGTHWIDREVRLTLPRFTAHVERDLTRIIRSRILHEGTF